MDEQGLIRSLAARQKEAWDEFVRVYSGLIYSYILSVLNRYCPGHQPVLPDELFHDFLISLADNNCRRLKSFKGKNGCTLASWLRQSAINFTIDHLRKIKPLASVDEEDDEGLALKELLPSLQGEAPDKMAHDEKVESLQDCIRRLAKDDKFFIEMYLDKGVELERIAKLLRLSRSATDVRKSRIIRKLRECFQEKGFFVP